MTTATYAAPTRRTDPETSRAAARIITPHVPTVRERVRVILDEHPGGLTHDQIIREHRRREWVHGWPRTTDSSIRTRTHELLRDGEVERVTSHHGVSLAGNRAVIWRAVNVQGTWTIGRNGGVR